MHVVRRIRGAAIIGLTLTPIIAPVVLVVATVMMVNAIVGEVVEPERDRVEERLKVARQEVDTLRTFVEDASEVFDGVGWDPADTAITSRVSNLRITAATIPNEYFSFLDRTTIGTVSGQKIQDRGPLVANWGGGTKLTDFFSGLDETAQAYDLLRAELGDPIVGGSDEREARAEVYKNQSRAILRSWLLAVGLVLVVVAAAWFRSSRAHALEELRRGWALLTGHPDPKADELDVEARIAELEARIANMSG
jgi:hypothetical protein